MTTHWLSVAGLPRDSDELLASDELRSVLLTFIVSPRCRVLSSRPQHGRLQRIRGVCNVSESCAIRTLLEPGLCPAVKRVERAEETQQRQSRCSALLQVHEGRQRRPGWHQVRRDLRRLREWSWRSDSEAESSDAGDISRHQQACSGQKDLRKYISSISIAINCECDKEKRCVSDLESQK